jgi:glutamyl-tRNA synthetase
MNGEYLKAMDEDKFFEMAKPYLEKALEGCDLDLKKIASKIKTRIEIFPDIEEQVDCFKAVPDYSDELYTNKKNKIDAAGSLSVLEDVLPILEAQDDYSNDALYAKLLAYAEEKGYKNGYVMWPIRIALSGKAMTPAGATEILEILGKEESLKRLNAAVAKLKA